ncbi:MAG: VCBS repeat-containing protein, partial [Candidatus Electryoneaceae bacterium]|nr:VCBS repeat-containing protein [Candidatus Electryoneaceae bacterium]
MQKLSLAILTLLICGSVAFGQDFELPEVICFIEGTPPGSTYFGREFCWVGDQNDDGFDDLLINHDPWNPGERNRVPHQANRVELFYGGEDMDDEPDVLFTGDEDTVRMGKKMNYLGYVMPDREPFVVFYTLRPGSNTNFIYELGDSLDNHPEYFMRNPPRQRKTLGKSHRFRPFDFNGDGYDDMITQWAVDNIERLAVYYGGGDFDTIPDWSVWCDYWNKEFSTGYDINGDGNDDILTRGDSNHGTYFAMFLGGDPPDTTALFSFDRDYFEGVTVHSGFSLLPDVNGDGYDDWGIFCTEDVWRNGYFIFFGGEEPDMEPDIILQGYQGMLSHRGDISGGDFNDDGYGDIVTGLAGASHYCGKVHLFFGRPELPQEMEADIRLNGYHDYGREYEA